MHIIPNKFLIVTYARCGARYLTAFLGNYFEELRKYSPKQINLDDTIVFNNGFFYKTHNHYKSNYNFDFPVILLERNIENVVKTFELEENKKFPNLDNKIFEFNKNWKLYKNIHIIQYEELIYNKEKIVNYLSNTFNLTFKDNGTRISELQKGIR